HLNPLLRVKNFQTLSSIDKNNELINLFVTSCSPFILEKYKEDKKWTFHLIDILHLAFSGREIDYDNEEIGFAAEFTRKVREYFVEKCMSLGCEVKYDGFDSLLLNLLGFVGNKRMLHEVKTLTGRLGEDQDEEEFSVSLLAVYASHLIPITDGILKLVESVHGMNSMRSEETDPHVYLVAKGTDKKKNVCSSFQCISNYFNNPNELNSIERYIEIVPVDTGRIMNYFFYSKAEKVVLSSGTWVMPQGLFKTYGLPSDCDIIKVPSTFPKENRPIYVIQNNNITNFSEKDGPVYVYKSEPGINKFVNETFHIIKMLREHILNKHGENSNIIVHCHTFDIAYKIAQYMPEMNERMMVHIPRYSNPIRNIHNGFLTSPMRKNDMVQFLEKNPNSGITLVSCSVSEGVDFKYDTARGQIILKRPTPSIGDPYINVQMKGNAKLQIKSNYNYFNSVVLTTMTQQYGRIVRAKDDYGYTVIMDQSICEMLKNILHPMNKFKRDMMNIDYFIEAMQYTIGKDGYPVFSWFSS
ncbi:MAG: hypothetical protein NT038_09635, partial [Euryarchaeota archaeon]|nr:hypothetical protein [Euryarchaeota archaeon]